MLVPAKVPKAGDVDLVSKHGQNSFLFQNRNRRSFYDRFLQQLIAILAALAKASVEFPMSYRISEAGGVCKQWDYLDGIVYRRGQSVT
jgi:hypothetical protein